MAVTKTDEENTRDCCDDQTASYAPKSGRSNSGHRVLHKAHTTALMLEINIG